jgi:hypothetical protein
MFFLWDFLAEQVCAGMIQAVVAGDMDTVHFLRDSYRMPLALGEQIAQPHISVEPNDYSSGNDVGFGCNLLPVFLRDECVQDNIRFVMCNMPEGGLCVSESETIPIFASVGITEQFVGVCHQRSLGYCDGGCAARGYGILTDDSGRRLVISADSLYRIPPITSGVVKTVTENRVNVVIPLIWKELL